MRAKPAKQVDPSDVRAARAAALDMLARRDRASGQLRDKLTRKGFEKGVAAAVVEELIDEKLLNDQRYVEHFVAYHAGRGQGPVRVRGELRQLGVDSDLIDTCIESYADWNTRVRETRRKKFGAAAPADYAEKARQSRFLSYRGFTSAQIRIALDFDEDL